MDSWNETQRHWDEFLDGIRQARAAVGATYAGAWFRGQTHSWNLSPSIFRSLPKLEESIKQTETRIYFQGLHLKKAQDFLCRKKLHADDEVVERLKETLRNLKKKLERLKQRRPENGRVPGEGRAYVEYKFRSGAHTQSSWQILAEMQHYGVPTRLLDWTESFVHALAFALAKYADLLTAKWNEERYGDAPSKLLKYQDIKCSHETEDGEKVEDRPTIWILNPYKLAEESKGRNVLWDPTLNRDDDYFQLFASHGSDMQGVFKVPIPILSPWNDERIAAQRGVFTCHGTDIRPLNHQLNSRAIRAVHISPEAAVHGVRFLSEIGGLDRFAMFRDKDRLGQKTKQEFLSFPLIRNDQGSAAGRAQQILNPLPSVRGDEVE